LVRGRHVVKVELFGAHPPYLSTLKNLGLTTEKGTLEKMKAHLL